MDEGASFSVMAVSSDSELALISEGDTFQISTNAPIYYGVSGAQSNVYLPQTVSVAPKSNGLYYIDSFILPEATTGLYLKSDGLSIDWEWAVDASYPDVESIDFFGSLRCQLNCVGPAWLYANASSYGILVNGVQVSSTGNVVDYTYTLPKGQTVSKVGFRFYFGDVFDLMATEATSASRSLVFQFYPPGTMGTSNSTNSTTGWFHALFAWLADIRDRINDLFSSVANGFSNVVSSIIALPGKIAEAIKSLFVPTDAQSEDLRTSFGNLLETKLGFVYQAGSLVTGVFDAVFDAVDNPDSDVSFTVPAFPAFSVDGTDVSLWEDSIVVDIADNQVVQTVQQVASPFVIAVMVWGFVHSMEDAFMAFVGGKSLSDWVRDRKGAKE